MPDYSRGKIYKITSGDLTYIGSTTEPTLAKRLANHVATYKRWTKGSGGKTSSYPLIELGQYEITLVELYPCNSKDELTARERFHIETNECVNKRIPGRSKEEYLAVTKHIIYERRLTKVKCICGGECALSCKARHTKSKKHQDFINSQSGR